ncbi:MAG: LamG-like jellyroll fold domain-containing protein, partial [Planctomycetota bacterium]|nr:LamG-like jellyroll fold domain-containing protein [Planctomycetota bacterium]
APDSIGRSFRVVEPGLMNIPVERFSIEALLSLDRVLPEGGVVAWADEDGRGWVLGQRDGHLGFGLASEDGQRHWVTAPQPFIPGQWYHVTATFDGSSTRLHVDGDPVAMSREVIGSVQPSEGTPLSFGGRYRDDVEGAEHGGVFFATLHNRNMSTSEIKEAAVAAAKRVPPSLQLRMSPAMKPLGKGRWLMTWETSTSGPSAVEWGTVFPLSNRVDSDGTGIRHEAVLEDVPRDRLVRFQVVGLVDDPRPVTMIQPQVRPGLTPPPPIPSGPTTVEARSPQMSFDTAFDYSNLGKGYILVWGLEDGRRACALARRYDMQVIAIDEDPSKVRIAREAAEAAGLHGDRVRVHQLAGETLPHAPYLFDYVTTERPVDGTAFTDRQNQELWRVLRPAGGILDIDRNLLGTAKSPPVSRSSSEAIVDRHRSGRRIYRRAPLKETGTWTHQYGDAANTACSQDDLVRGDMGVLWWGRPGPRPMMDRGARTPAPLMAGHRMFIQANRQLIALNAYNGAILWSLQVPGLRRVNVPRDCSNMVASLDDKLYVAIDDRLWVIDAQTGERVAIVDVPVQVDTPLDWGFISRVDGHVLGTGVRPGSTYTGAEGEWYDGGGEESWRVTSDVLFSMDPADHDLQWSHVPRGRLLNSTITVDEGNVYYIEARSGLANGSESGRIGQASLREQYLVAVDLETGRRSWETPIEVDHFDRMTYLLKSNGALVVVGTSDKFHVLVFNADDGSLRWQQDHAWDRDHHGGPLQHPVIFGNEVFVERLAYDLENGDITREGIPQGRGCGTKSASKHLVLFRHYFHSFWDPGSDAWTEWTGTRGGCWLGMLPVGGIVLAPESSSGCSCTHAIQTSMAFVPRRSDPTFSRIDGDD